MGNLLLGFALRHNSPSKIQIRVKNNVLCSIKVPKTNYHAQN